MFYKNTNKNPLCFVTYQNVLLLFYVLAISDNRYFQKYKKLAKHDASAGVSLSLPRKRFSWNDSRIVKLSSHTAFLIPWLFHRQLPNRLVAQDEFPDLEIINLKKATRGRRTF